MTVDAALIAQESLWRHGVVHDPAKKKVKVTCQDVKIVCLYQSISYLSISFSCVDRCIYIFFLFSLQKLIPKKNQPWRRALQVRLAAAANQADTNKLAEKLQKTTLV